MTPRPRVVQPSRADGCRDRPPCQPRKPFASIGRSHTQLQFSSRICSLVIAKASTTRPSLLQLPVTPGRHRVLWLLFASLLGGIVRDGLRAFAILAFSSFGPVPRGSAGPPLLTLLGGQDRRGRSDCFDPVEP